MSFSNFHPFTLFPGVSISLTLPLAFKLLDSINSAVLSSDLAGVIQYPLSHFHACLPNFLKYLFHCLGLSPFKPLSAMPCFPLTWLITFKYYHLFNYLPCDLALKPQSCYFLGLSFHELMEPFDKYPSIVLQVLYRPLPSLFNSRHPLV